MHRPALHSKAITPPSQGRACTPLLCHHDQGLLIGVKTPKWIIIDSNIYSRALKERYRVF